MQNISMLDYLANYKLRDGLYYYHITNYGTFMVKQIAL